MKSKLIAVGLTLVLTAAHAAERTDKPTRGPERLVRLFIAGTAAMNRFLTRGATYRWGDTAVPDSKLLSVKMTFPRERSTLAKEERWSIVSSKVEENSARYLLKMTIIYSDRWPGRRNRTFNVRLSFVRAAGRWLLKDAYIWLHSAIKTG